MKLEQEIKQSKFSSEYQKVAVNVAFTHFWILDRLRQNLQPHGISMQQFNLLRILRGQLPEPATINLIKERMLDKSSDASRLVERLRLKGLVDRVTSAHDRRSVDIKITEKGLGILKKIDDSEKWFYRQFESLTPDEAAQLNGLLDKLRGEQGQDK